MGRRISKKQWEHIGSASNDREYRKRRAEAEADPQGPPRKGSVAADKAKARRNKSLREKTAMQRALQKALQQKEEARRKKDEKQSATGNPYQGKFNVKDVPSMSELLIDIRDNLSKERRISNA